MRTLVFCLIFLAMSVSLFGYTPPDLGARFPDLGFARGDLLNFKFDQLLAAITDLIFVSSASYIIPASAPARVHFDMTAGATIASWPAASMTYETGVDNITVFVNGIYQQPLYDWSELSSASVLFTSPLPIGCRVGVLRNMFFEAGTPAATPARVRVVTTASTTVSWSSWQMQYTMGDDRLVLFLNGIYQDPTNYTEVSSTSITLDSTPLAGWYADLMRLY